ncbi:4-alpha-glucanotransferase [[Haemophilus] felis]|uniref:4-alpha-glucanotransferase n=1 Tax=[Haemophilus] felis TaxID=123822 RepID=A0A1T0AWX5_9PAST|nr:4-alpha-glucanotransferase [[Haemophilus] felis]OOS01874.1 4-alpha-glucanotransferase [[Haemophilus] felis]
MNQPHSLICPFFVNEYGQQIYPSDETLHKMSSLLGESKPDSLLPPVRVIKQGEKIVFALKENTAQPWRLALENHSILQGHCQSNQIELPNDLPLGYHQLTLGESSCRLIITPEKCFQPVEIQSKQKLWGAILQLYTLRSEHNWGIGDFGDLKLFLTKLAEKGGDFIGLNPIHALFPANPESASPYSPSSRLWLNIIYLDVTAIDAFQQSSTAQIWFYSDDIQRQLNEARNKDYVDYSQVLWLKLTGLHYAYEHFKQEDQKEFEQFIATQGESLKVQGTFDALHQWLSSQFTAQWGWNNWSKEYQHYQNPSVQQFQQEQADSVRFYMWLQFVAQQQLKSCDELAQQLGMPIGFYRDLAVGVADNGAETWADKELYVLDSSIGAPPDVLAPQGQNWGLSPMHPEVLEQRGYQPFIDLLRANMQHCGALRIDHILVFARMWWVAKGDSAQNGVYIKYPLEDLLAILALESQRNQCLIIAEALGTVPEGMLTALEDKGILAYNIFYFEFDHNGSKPLANYPYQAMTTLSTHDLPTIQGYWKTYDFELGQRFGVYPNSDVVDMLKNNRHHNKLMIRKAVEETQYLEPDYMGITQTFNHQLQMYVAETNSALFGTQPEDWLHMLEPVNIPGTSTEYPNWRRKLSRNIEEIFNDEGIRQLLNGIKRKRKSIK